MKNKTIFTCKSIFYILAAVLLSFSLFSAVSYTNLAKAEEPPTTPYFVGIVPNQRLYNTSIIYDDLTIGASNQQLIIYTAIESLKNIGTNISTLGDSYYYLYLSDSTGRVGYILLSAPYYPSSYEEYTVSVSLNNVVSQPLRMSISNGYINSFNSYRFTQDVYIDSVYLSSGSNSYNITPSYPAYSAILYYLNIVIPIYGTDNLYNAGYDQGLEEGGVTEEELEEIRQNAYDEGYQDSQDSLQSQIDSARQDGYDDGYDVGYDEGFEEAEAYVDEARQQGYDQGYSDGVSDMIDESSNLSWYGLFTAIIDVPVRIFSSLFDFEVFGINLAGFFVSILSIFVIIFILKKLL